MLLHLVSFKYKTDTDAATTAEVIEVMDEGRRRVKQRFGIELEPEVQSLGPVPIPDDWRGR